MPNPTQVTDVEARMPRPLTDPEKALAEVLIGDAWEELLVRVRDLDARLDDARTSTSLVVRVVASMVVRVLKNPDAIRQWQVDDASFTRDQAVSAGLLYATDAEINLLSGGSTSHAAAFTIRPTGRPSSCTLPGRP